MNISTYQNFTMYRQSSQPKKINSARVEKQIQQREILKKDTISFCGAHQGYILEKDK